MAEILPFIPDHQRAIHNRDLPAPRWIRQKIGLLGGSFNPAHEGHLHISKQAIRSLKLDRLWWLVSPQNPLKATDDMAPFAERMASAEAMAQHPKITVTGIEQKLGTGYTVETLERLQGLFPRARFVWVMGADNLQQFHAWQGWQQIAEMLPIAVLDRAPYTYKALKSEAATQLQEARVGRPGFAQLADVPPPAWAYIRIPRHPASSTAIREGDLPLPQ